MAGKVLKTLVVAAGVLVLGLLALITVYLIGYGFLAIFSHSGMEAGAARSVGAAAVVVIAIVVLWLFFRSRRAGTPAAGETHHSHRDRAA